MGVPVRSRAARGTCWGSAFGSGVMPRCDTHSISTWKLLVVLALAPLCVLRGQTLHGDGVPGSRSANYGHSVPVPSAVAAPVRGHIVLDGKLDEAAWALARPITEFTQLDPDEGKPASEKSEVRFLFDADALYVGA